MAQSAKLALEDGTVYTGISFGAIGEVDGEVVFNTSMTGYQEILTDPSYRGQIVTMTYPEIGNYGVNQEDVESEHPHLAGFIVREKSRIASNFRCTGRLHEYLMEHGVVGLAEIDTRALVRRIRTHGAMKGILSSADLDDASLVGKARASRGLVGRDLVREVVPAQEVEWSQGLSSWARSDSGSIETESAGCTPCRCVGFRHEMEYRSALSGRRVPCHNHAGHGDCAGCIGTATGRGLSFQRPR